MTDWPLRVKKGDVLRAPSGALRIVRAVSPGVSMRKTWFFFAIMRCSWTHAGYTLYNGGELLQMKWEPTGMRQRLGTKLDRTLAGDFGRHSKDRTLTCCDVVGLP